MLNPDRVYMLAADHRWQWEEWCDARAMARDRIRDAKRVAYDGFLRARRQSSAVRQFGAMLLDEHYASAVIAEGLRDGVEIGTPAEKAGAFPLEWTTDPFDRVLTGAFVKVLVRHRPDHDAAVREDQFAKLAILQRSRASRSSWRSWSRANTNRKPNSTQRVARPSSPR
jgi:myo-inositol catabolism protein IolC